MICGGSSIAANIVVNVLQMDIFLYQIILEFTWYVIDKIVSSSPNSVCCFEIESPQPTTRNHRSHRCSSKTKTSKMNVHNQSINSNGIPYMYDTICYNLYQLIWYLTKIWMKWWKMCNVRTRSSLSPSFYASFSLMSFYQAKFNPNSKTHNHHTVLIGSGSSIIITQNGNVPLKMIAWISPIFWGEFIVLLCNGPAPTIANKRQASLARHKWQ